jgi:hypothetical protein
LSILSPYPRGDKVMYDVNPLGPQMHLKQLERRAVPMLRPVRFFWQSRRFESRTPLHRDDLASPTPSGR